MRRASRRQEIRHEAIADWRGVEDGPLINGEAMPLGSLVSQVLKTWKLDEKLREDDVAAAWQAIVGEFNSRHTAPDGLKKGVLTIRILQPTLHYTLRMQKATLLKRLQDRFGVAEIKDLKFRHG